jgi:hypothetical protein
MKYLVVKSILGFGDRLESLAMCINFAQNHNLKVYVDWSDPVWGDSFYKYFSLNVPYFDLDEANGLSVYPEYWKDKLHESLTHETYSKTIELDILTSYTSDVVVAVCGGVRNIYPDYSFMGLKLIHPSILHEVRRRQSVYALKDKWCVHLRGTDRCVSKEHRERRFQELYLKLVTRGLLNFSNKCVVLSDDPEYVSLWKRRDKSPVLSELFDTGTKGLHYSTPEDLGTTKEQLNIQLLIDFFTMASCKQIFTTCLDSRFAKLAGRLNPCIRTIL